MAELIAAIGIASGTLGILLPAFNIVKEIANIYDGVRFGRKRCKDVILRAGFMIKQVHSTLQSLDQTGLQHNVERLTMKLKEVQTIMQKLADRTFFKALLRFDDVNSEIEQANHHLTDCLQLFQIELLMHMADRNKAAKSDHDDLLRLLSKLAGNYTAIRRCFDIHSDEQENEAMAVMERELTSARLGTSCEEDMPVEMQILQKSFECIKTTTGKSAPKQNKWLITEYDLDYCGSIGGGGFSTVSKARYRGMMVAVKKLKDIGSMKETLEREVEIWSSLRHDHIVPFYGASTLTTPHIIVSRYMRNGNLVRYLINHPNVDRIKLLYETCLGMYHLHEEHIIHGDLKGFNVLVDDSGKACIADFGLSKGYYPAVAGEKAKTISGTLRFLAPEALKGQPLNFQTDVYAFGMLIYEVFTGDVPFIMEPDNLVRQGCLELQRPNSAKVHGRGLDDTIWQLLSDCISREPTARPRFKTVHTRIQLMRNTPCIQTVDEDAEGGLVLGSTLMGPTSHTAVATAISVTPLLKEARSESGKQFRVLSSRSISRDTSTVSPMCIAVTHKHFGVTFGIASSEPGARLEDNSWLPIKPKKGSLLSGDEKRFTYRSRVGEVTNSCELDGTNVILCNPSTNPGICRFENAFVARRWFSLQMNFSRDGSMGDWGKTQAIGDWLSTQRTWRRFVSGKLQQASLVEGASDLVPSKAWSDVKFPKRFTPDMGAWNRSRIVCITNPGKQAGKLCCKREGRSILFETYRQQSDQRPITAREETYTSEEDAEVMFAVLRAVLGTPRK